MIQSIAGVLISIPFGALMTFALIVFAKGFIGWPPGEPRDYAWAMFTSGAVLGCVTAIYEYRRLQRRADARKLAKKPSLWYSAKGSKKIAQRLKGLTGRRGHFALENVIQGGRRGVQTLIGDLVNTIHSGDDTDVTRDTVIYFTGRDLYFPQFALQPEGQLLSFVGRLTGQDDIDFEDHPTFSDAYHLSSSESEVVRSLFGPELLDYFAKHNDWEIRAEHEYMMLAPGGQAPIDDWESLLDESREILTLFNKAVDRMLESPPQVVDRSKTSAEGSTARSTARRDTVATNIVDRTVDRSAEQQSALSTMVASLAAAVESRSVGWGEVEAFLNLPTPRTISDRIGRQYKSYAPILAFILCLPTSLGGLMFIVVGALNWDNSGWFPVLIGLFLIMLVVAAIDIGYDFHRRRKRLLRDGVLTNATIRNVRSTAWSSGGTVYYQANVQYSAGDNRHDRTVTLQGSHVDMARKCADNSEPTPLLYDPKKPKRFLLGLQLTSQRIRI